MGLVVATVYILTLFCFIPFPFLEWIPGATAETSILTFPHDKACFWMWM
jgi:hypothetical protein